MGKMIFSAFEKHVRSAKMELHKSRMTSKYVMGVLITFHLFIASLKFAISLLRILVFFSFFCQTSWATIDRNFLVSKVYWMRVAYTMIWCTCDRNVTLGHRRTQSFSHGNRKRPCNLVTRYIRSMPPIIII